jgi:hypothetical protein
MGDQVMLMIGDTKFLLSIDEAMGIAKTLNSASVVERAWIKDVDSDKSHVIKPPSFKAACVVPMTAILQIEIDSNMKLMEAKK